MALLLFDCCAVVWDSCGEGSKSYRLACNAAVPRILGGRQLLVYVRTVDAAIFDFIAEEDWGENCASKSKNIRAHFSRARRKSLHCRLYLDKLNRRVACIIESRPAVKAEELSIVFG